MKGMGGMQQLVRQATQLQAKVKKLQEELATRDYEGSSGGGAVQVKLKGETTITSLIINEEVVKSGDVEMLQDLIVTAINDVLRTAKETSASEMNKITGNMGMPGLF